MIDCGGLENLRMFNLFIKRFSFVYSGHSLNTILLCSANALTDLLQGRQIQQLEPYLQDLWNMSFRALDDVKVAFLFIFKT